MNRKLSFFLFLASLIFAACSQEPADTLIKGKIFTSDPDMPYAGEIAIKDGKVVYVGDDASHYLGNQTQVITSQGLVLPGFADVHTYGAEAMRLFSLIHKFGRDSIFKLDKPLSLFNCTEEEKEECIIKFQNYAISQGITTILQAQANYPGFELKRTYENLDKQGKLAVHTYAAFGIDIDTDLKILDTISLAATSMKGGNFQINAVKVDLIDGNWPDRLFSRTIDYASRSNLPLIVNSSDGESQQMMFSKFSTHGLKSLSNSVVGLDTLSEDDFRVMRERNLVAVVNPLRSTFNIASFKEKGIGIAFGSDYPVYNTLSPLQAVALMVSSSMNVDDALRCITLGGAHLLGRDSLSGSIKVGKDADIVFIDKDITLCSGEDIPSAQVVRTMIGGKTLYLSSDSVR